MQIIHYAFLYLFYFLNYIFPYLIYSFTTKFALIKSCIYSFIFSSSPLYPI
nr:MAG TPA: hypothetical protein [Caudoviricetes sp.]